MGGCWRGRVAAMALLRHRAVADGLARPAAGEARAQSSHGSEREEGELSAAHQPGSPASDPLCPVLLAASSGA